VHFFDPGNKAVDYTAQWYRVRAARIIGASGAESSLYCICLMSAMTESEFNDRIDGVFYALELQLDKIDSDMDYEAGGGVLTLEFDNGSTMVFSRQPPTRQLWLATRAGGFHFEYDPAVDDWRNTRDQTLFRAFVINQMKEQGGIEFSWD
jgi:CyaY protein